MKKLVFAFALAALMLFGCTQLSGPSGAKNTTGAPVAAANVTQGTASGQANTSAGAANNTAPNGTANASAPETPVSRFAHYDLSVSDIRMNTTNPSLSFYNGLSATVRYEGQTKPSRYQVIFSEGGDPITAKTVESPNPEENVSFDWLALADGDHNVTVSVQTFADEKVTEDGPTSNNAVSSVIRISPIGTVPGDGGYEVDGRYKRAQEFVVGHRIGVGSVELYLKADARPDDVPLVVEIRRNDVNAPGMSSPPLKQTRLSAKDIGPAAWYRVSYGVNGLYLDPGKYWIVAYLEDNSNSNPTWVSGSAYGEQSAVLDRESGSGNIWTAGGGAYAFRVSTSP